MCFGHIMSKAYQYATNDEKVIMSLKKVNVMATQENLQKTITLTKKLGEGR
jgi:isocitrate/isopropylmalate dehydrogenase